MSRNVLIVDKARLLWAKELAKATGLNDAAIALISVMPHSWC